MVEGIRIISIYTSGFVFKDNKCHIAYINKDFSQRLLDKSFLADEGSSIGPSYRYRVQKAIDKGIVKEGVDYVLFPISIKYNKLNVTL